MEIDINQIILKTYNLFKQERTQLKNILDRMTTNRQKSMDAYEKNDLENHEYYGKLYVNDFKMFDKGIQEKLLPTDKVIKDLLNNKNLLK